MTKRYFHFTLGPVQGFVAQARRTRDFWAGSFLLSWLAGIAMNSVKNQNGKIVFPLPDENYLKWLKGEAKKSPPHQGNIPNRFKAEVDDNFNPQQIVNEVKSAWQELAELVWQQDLAVFCTEDPIHRQIWERQIDNFFEITWVITDNQAESNLLDRRKNWRNHFTPAEPGVKCMIMTGWQELSGVDSPDSEKLEKFWKKIREQKLKRDLAKQEKLCAIAFVKRRFAKYFHKLQSRWHLETGFPSVAYLAVAHWLEHIILHEDEQKLEALYIAAKKLGTEYGEWHTDIKCIDQAYKNKKHIKPLTALDGRVFFESELLNEEEENQAAAKEMLAALKNIEEKPSPFYAILLMDGDSLGKHMSSTAKQPVISEALKNFTDEVNKIVSKNNGVLIYSGGDDVLAILPLEDALSCAKELRDEYLKAFEVSSKKYELSIKSTLSGAIEYAHIKMPLTKILRDSHSLLDNIAKDGCGRDAIAVRVWKQGGKAAQWAMPWKKALNENNELIIEQLVEKFKQDNEFSNSFFYKIRERFDLLNPAKGERAILNADESVSLLAADYVSGNRISLTEAEQKIKPLLEQCRLKVRQLDDDEKETFTTKKRLEVDGALLVRFLATKGME
jgi:CRISPR-associated protein Cmr2